MMVMTESYNPCALVESPKAFRTFLRCEMSRVTIMRVRRTLSATEIEKYGMPMLAAKEFHMLLGCEVLYTSIMPTAAWVT